MSAADFTGFGPGAFRFFRGLAKHNEKGWFEAHRDEYEREVRLPMRALIEEVDARLGDVAPELVGEPRKSMFRIHRDVRFSKDKRPYKENAACWFFHRDVRRLGEATGEQVHGGAGLYFHLAPGNCFAGGGIWMPPRPALLKIRERIADDPEEWEEIVRSAGFRRRFGELDQEGMLQRVPRGYAPDHPAAPWLRYTSFTAGWQMSDADVQGPKLVDRLLKGFVAILPFVRYLNQAVGLKPHDRR